MITWPGERAIEIDRPDATGWLRLVFRLLCVVLVSALLLLPLLAVRALESDGGRRSIVGFACRLALRVLGLRISVRGTVMQQSGGLVANHCSWLDVIVLNSVQGAYFVSKAEVRDWPLCGVLARAAGTVFIRRRVMDALLQKLMFAARLKRGHRLLFFPEGTSTDGLRVLPFRSSLFAAFFDEEFWGDHWIQPVCLAYSAPPGRRRDFYGWWGNASFIEHAAMIISAPRQGRVEVTFHDPVPVANYADRKQLSKVCEACIGSTLDACLNIESAPINVRPSMRDVSTGIRPASETGRDVEARPIGVDSVKRGAVSLADRQSIPSS